MRVEVFRHLNAPAISVRRQLARHDPLAEARGANEVLRSRRRCLPRQHPRDDVAAEEIQHDIQRIPLPVHRAFELGDVPRPPVIRRARHEPRNSTRGMRAQGPPFAHFGLRVEQALHRADAADIETVVEERGVDLCRGCITESVVVQIREGLGLGRCRQRARRRGARQPRRGSAWLRQRAPRAALIPRPLQRKRRREEAFAPEQRADLRGHDKAPNVAR